MTPAQAGRLIRAVDRLRLLRDVERVTGRVMATHTDIIEVEAAIADVDGRPEPRSSGRRR